MKTFTLAMLLATAFTTAHAATTQPAMINIDGHPVLFDDIMQVLAPSPRQPAHRHDMTMAAADTAARGPAAPAPAPPANCPYVPEPVPLQRPLPKAFADFLAMLQGKIEASVPAAAPSVAAALPVTKASAEPLI